MKMITGMPPETIPSIDAVGWIMIIGSVIGAIVTVIYIWKTGLLKHL